VCHAQVLREHEHIGIVLQEDEQVLLESITEARKRDRRVRPNAIILCACCARSSARTFEPALLADSEACSAPPARMEERHRRAPVDAAPEVQEIDDQASRHRRAAYLWSNAAAAAVTIQRYWRGFRARKQWLVQRRKLWLAKRTASMRRHLVRKWKWMDAVGAVIAKGATHAVPATVRSRTNSCNTCTQTRARAANEPRPPASHVGAPAWVNVHGHLTPCIRSRLAESHGRGVMIK
jgi:IQ calmodulin-binding motif